MNFTCSRRRATAWALAALVTALGLGIAAADPERGATAPACDLRHPLDVRMRPLDPVVRGGSLRVHLEVRPDVGVERLRVEPVSLDGATLISRAPSDLGKVEAGESATTSFTVQLPDAGQRFLLVWRVRGEGAMGLLSRDATLNLLPDGPADPGVKRTTSTGERIVEYEARRVGR